MKLKTTTKRKEKVTSAVSTELLLAFGYVAGKIVDTQIDWKPGQVGRWDVAYLPDGKTPRNHPSKSILKILFKEILEQISPDDAERLTNIYIKGEEIGFRIRQNSRGTSYKTAFQPFAEPEGAINTPVEQTEAVVVKNCSLCGRELTGGKCVFINHKN